MSSRNRAALTPDPIADLMLAPDPGAAGDTGESCGATEFDCPTGGGPGTHRIRGDDGTGAACTGGTGAGGMYCGALIGHRGICAELLGIAPGGRNSSA